MNIDNKVIKYNRYANGGEAVDRLADCMKVLKYMAINGAITRYEANEIGVGRLAARIHDLRFKYHKNIVDAWSGHGMKKHKKYWIGS